MKYIREYSTLNEEQQQAIVEEIAIEEFEKFEGAPFLGDELDPRVQLMIIKQIRNTPFIIKQKVCFLF
ncbi:hypothetical protein ABH966_001986 [Lysinibacillus sp. RC46]|uniref:hypothetical protein n=1 Tax=unclassified Lysinibacillus TaxID=2636778 RepID=UPI0035194489